MELHERLKRARQRRFRTAKEASDYLGIPYATLTSHEAGTRGVKRGEIERYAKTYRVELPWLERELGAAVWRPSYLDLLLFPVRCQAPECGADFSIAVRGLVDRDSVNCPQCSGVVDLKKLKPAINDLARVAAELDKMADQPE